MDDPVRIIGNGVDKMSQDLSDGAMLAVLSARNYLLF
jgi:hypothetical protein